MVPLACFALLATLLTNPAAPQTQPPIAIVGATIVDGTGSPPRTATVVIRGERIEAVAPDVKPPDGARVIDAKGHTLLPGLSICTLIFPTLRSPD